MQLSIIIVNYNVKYFLEHCLLSVQRACVGMEAEVWVVDNYSGDGSVQMIEQRFSWVKLIANKDNVGFAKANNQAVAKATGKYILYLNPDTIVPEDCFTKCFAYMEANPKVGALGCRLIDGRGQFLPESKRGFPSAQAAFFKISGLSSLFKKSKFFNQYHLGFLPELETNRVDVLVGCFMFCRKEVIDQVGSFDETYFMYGEDIDLSYKIKKAGYENVYFPETSVIHYKGESTNKGSLNYVKMFYQAMVIFAQKHFTGVGKGAFVALIRVAIYMRAVIALFSRLLKIIKLPLLDAVVILISLQVTKSLWIKNVKPETEYTHLLILGFFLSYTFTWLSSLFLNGTYDAPYKPQRLIRGMFVGGVLTLAVYGLLPEDLRFSRGITLIGAVLSTVLLLAYRQVLSYLNILNLESDRNEHKVIVVGDANDEQEVNDLWQKAFVKKNVLGTLSAFDKKESYQLGIFSHLKPLVALYGAKEIIYTQGPLSFKQIIDSMQQCGPTLEYKLHSQGTDSIIGSNSKNTAGDLYTTELIYDITTPSAKRNKRVVDILFSFAFLVFTPLCIWFVKNKKHYLGNMFLVLEGDKTFVGYDDAQFPPLKPHLLTVYDRIENYEIPYDNKEHLNWLYAKHYTAWQDVRIIWKRWREV